MKLAIVGPGIMEIPPKGWGAVEIIIHDYSNAMRALGWDVLVVNTPRRPEIVSLVNAFAPDFVHIHYDEFADLADSFSCPNVAVTSHFGYLDQVWGQRVYRENVHRSIVANSKLHVFALSPSIAEVYESDGKPSDLISVLPNGVRTDLFRQTSTPTRSGRSICLGKIEPRKQQGLLQSLDLGIDFAGVIGDLAGRWPFDTERGDFLGPWTKEQVYDRLCEYGNLVLLSDAEAHPLVVMEAMAAGLGVVVSEAAAANLDRSRPFVEVVPQDRVTDRAYVASAIARNRQVASTARMEIAGYAKQFDWQVAAHRFDDAIRSIVAPPHPTSSIARPRAKKKVALLTVATGAYFDLFYSELKSSVFQNFCVDECVHIFCFTDRPASNSSGETFCHVPALEWPFSTLLRYTLFSTITDKLRDFDLIFYLDSDMRVEAPIPFETLDSDFVAVEHPSFRHQTQRPLGPNPPPYEIDASSNAFVEPYSRTTYVQGCLFGGRRTPFLYLVRKLAALTADDFRNGQVPVWHDESYLNFFFSSHTARLLPPAYAYPEGWTIPDPVIICHRKKPHDTVRNTMPSQFDVHSLVRTPGAATKELYRQLYLQAHEKNQRLEARLTHMENAILAVRWHIRRHGLPFARSLRRIIAASRRRILRH